MSLLMTSTHSKEIHQNRLQGLPIFVLPGSTSRSWYFFCLFRPGMTLVFLLNFGVPHPSINRLLSLCSLPSGSSCLQLLESKKARSEFTTCRCPWKPKFNMMVYYFKQKFSKRDHKKSSGSSACPHHHPTSTRCVVFHGFSSTRLPKGGGHHTDSEHHWSSDKLRKSSQTLASFVSHTMALLGNTYELSSHYCVFL